MQLLDRMSVIEKVALPLSSLAAYGVLYAAYWLFTSASTWDQMTLDWTDGKCFVAHGLFRRSWLLRCFLAFLSSASP
jgi:hypothetical protein